MPDYIMISDSNDNENELQIIPGFASFKYCFETFRHIDGSTRSRSEARWTFQIWVRSEARRGETVTRRSEARRQNVASFRALMGKSSPSLTWIKSSQVTRYLTWTWLENFRKWLDLTSIWKFLGMTWLDSTWKMFWRRMTWLDSSRKMTWLDLSFVQNQVESHVQKCICMELFYALHLWFLI